jgi:hypothetical protein
MGWVLVRRTFGCGKGSGLRRRGNYELGPILLPFLLELLQWGFLLGNGLQPGLGVLRGRRGLGASRRAPLGLGRR